ncbi:hypothetical protein M404DRAFT_13558 [Pisolithus tinctorius Marx 270]|uniref:DUF202 domain-containing protein n=1 Tax=Pisolithus tinctorius Marx 270 TaxID=870435 RepID=A0A0C3PAZ6_PISTI|nr:hypothetical protein M404DRAFT_13558 [Pisolithus tinctorius Marx 270]
MPMYAEIAGSTVRDFCMLERNYLSYFKLVLLLLLLLCSSLLGTRLPAPSESDGGHASMGGVRLPIAILLYIAALLTVAAAVWEYHTGVKCLLKVRAFLVGTRIHLSLMSVVSVIAATTCIVYLASENR